MRWSIQVPAADDAIVRRAADHAGLPLAAFVHRAAVAAAADDLSERQILRVSDSAWNELQAILDRPPTPRPRIAALMAGPTVLDAE